MMIVIFNMLQVMRIGGTTNGRDASTAGVNKRQARAMNSPNLNGATFSQDRKYRYQLWRTWDKRKPCAVFIGLNPSTADEVKNDPTVTRCVNFAKYWNCGKMIMLNIFAFRATNPTELQSAVDPRNDVNNMFIEKIVRGNVGPVIAGWGNHGALHGRDREVRLILKKTFACVQVFGLTRTGQPKHPLYLAARQELCHWIEKGELPKC